MTKVQELMVDLRRTRDLLSPDNVQEISVDIVEVYKYFGMYLDYKLDWAKNVEIAYKKNQRQMYYLMSKVLQHLPNCVLNALRECSGQQCTVCFSLLGQQLEGERQQPT